MCKHRDVTRDEYAQISCCSQSGSDFDDQESRTDEMRKQKDRNFLRDFFVFDKAKVLHHAAILE